MQVLYSGLASKFPAFTALMTSLALSRTSSLSSGVISTIVSLSNRRFQFPALPTGLPSGDYRPLVIVYDPADGSERGRLLLAPVALQGNPIRPPRRALEASLASTVYARFGDLELLGFTPPDPTVTYQPGEQLPLTLLWQSLDELRGELRAEWRLEAVVDTLVGVEAVGGMFQTSRWREGQVVRQWPVLVLPDGIPAGTYLLRMRLTRDGQPVPWGRGFLPLGSDLDLGPVVVGIPTPG